MEGRGGNRCQAADLSWITLYHQEMGHAWLDTVPGSLHTVASPKSKFLAPKRPGLLYSSRHRPPPPPCNSFWALHVTIVSPGIAVITAAASWEHALPLL